LDFCLGKAPAALVLQALEVVSQGTALLLDIPDDTHTDPVLKHLMARLVLGEVGPVILEDFSDQRHLSEDLVCRLFDTDCCMGALVLAYMAGHSHWADG
jgi:AraC-like DNA-binding protein